MARLGKLLLCAVLSSLVLLGQGDEVTTEKPVTIVLPVVTSSATTESTTTSSTSQSTSTTVPTTTSTEPTTTQKPTTTTPKPTTTTPPPTTTTPKPKPPAPLPPPEQGLWSYTDPKTNVTCLLVQFAAQLNVTYTKENSTTLPSVLLNVPSNATVIDGSCAANDSRQWISLSWAVGDTQPNNMTLVFYKNDTTKNYNLQFLNVTLTPELFPNAASNATIYLSHGAEWLTPLATSYRCAAATRLNMTASQQSSVQAAAVTLSRLQEEAFRTSSSKGFSAARECGGGDVPDAVPIAVGCALGGLVVVVLIAYMVARRRSSSAVGYLSMCE